MSRAALLLAGVGLLLAGCGTGLPDNLPSDRDTTNQTRPITDLWDGAWIAALLVGLLVWGLIIWAVVVYRRRRDDTGLPAQVRYNVPIEILYTLVPLMMVAVLFYFTADTQAAITNLSARPDVKINVVGKQWAWDFNYVEQGGRPLDAYEAGVQVQLTGRESDELQSPVLYLPVDRTVQFSLTSRDVNHSFWIPGFLFKMDLIAGVDNRFEVRPQKLGEYRGKCAELCGQYHSEMLFRVRVVPQAEFDRQIAALRARGQTGRLSSDLGRTQTQDRPGGAIPGGSPNGNDGTGNK